MRNTIECVCCVIFNPFAGKPPKVQEPLLWTNHHPTDQPTDRLTAEELKYSHNRAWRH
jgi:hypothetical protein